MLLAWFWSAVWHVELGSTCSLAELWPGETGALLRRTVHLYAGIPAAAWARPVRGLKVYFQEHIALFSA